MKISDMIKNLYAFMDEHGDVECWYAEDDEGNGFRPVYFEPSLRYVNEDEETFQEEDLEDMDKEDREDIGELTKICVVN